MTGYEVALLSVGDEVRVEPVNEPARCMQVQDVELLEGLANPLVSITDMNGDTVTCFASEIEKI